jgi:hypothetical protein
MSVCSSFDSAQLETIDHTNECAGGGAERAYTSGGDPCVLSGASSGYGQGLGHAEDDKAFVGESSERRVYRSERGWPFRALLDLAFDGHRVGIVAEPLQGGEDENFEFAEKVAFGHARLSTKAKI